MTSFVTENFDVPSGFLEEQTDGQIYLEDLNDDDELWLIRMPSDIELSLLDRKKIFLSDNLGEDCVKDIKTENGELLECYSERCDVPNLSVVLPQKANKKLRAVNKSFSGTILISKGFALDEEAKVKSENEVDSKAHIITSSIEPEQKNNKKKKKHFNLSENSDLNYETEDAESASAVKHKKHGRKHSDKQNNSSVPRVHIKTEPLSIDSEEFPHCQSQK